jgi:Na+/proline symporter
LTETLATYMGIGIMGGVVWRRANRWGAVASMAVAMAVNFALYWLRGERLDSWNPNVFLAALLAGTAALVIGSLLTAPEDAPKLKSFYERLETPTAGPAETAAKEGRQLLLVNLFHLRRGAQGLSFLRAYRTDLKGFAIGWCLALALLGGVWLLFRA